MTGGSICLITKTKFFFDLSPGKFGAYLYGLLGIHVAFEWSDDPGGNAGPGQCTIAICNQTLLVHFVNIFVVSSCVPLTMKKSLVQIIRCNCIRVV